MSKKLQRQAKRKRHSHSDIMGGVRTAHFTKPDGTNIVSFRSDDGSLGNLKDLEKMLKAMNGN